MVLFRSIQAHRPKWNNFWLYLALAFSYNMYIVLYCIHVPPTERNKQPSSRDRTQPHSYTYNPAVKKLLGSSRITLTSSSSNLEAEDLVDDEIRVSCRRLKSVDREKMRVKGARKAIRSVPPRSLQRVSHSHHSNHSISRWWWCYRDFWAIPF